MNGLVWVSALFASANHFWLVYSFVCVCVYYVPSHPNNPPFRTFHMTSNERACGITCHLVDGCHRCRCATHCKWEPTRVSLFQYDAASRDVAKYTLLLFYSIPYFLQTRQFADRVFYNYLHTCLNSTCFCFSVRCCSAPILSISYYLFADAL